MEKVRNMKRHEISKGAMLFKLEALGVDWDVTLWIDRTGINAPGVMKAAVKAVEGKDGEAWLVVNGVEYSRATVNLRYNDGTQHQQRGWKNNLGFIYRSDGGTPTDNACSKIIDGCAEALDEFLYEGGVAPYVDELWHLLHVGDLQQRVRELRRDRGVIEKQIIEMEDAIDEGMNGLDRVKEEG